MLHLCHLLIAISASGERMPCDLTDRLIHARAGCDGPKKLQGCCHLHLIVLERQIIIDSICAIRMHAGDGGGIPVAVAILRINAVAQAEHIRRCHPEERIQHVLCTGRFCATEHAVGNVQLVGKSHGVHRIFTWEYCYRP